MSANAHHLRAVILCHTSPNLPFQLSSFLSAGDMCFTLGVLPIQIQDVSMRLGILFSFWCISFYVHADHDPAADRWRPCTDISINLPFLATITRPSALPPDASFLSKPATDAYSPHA